MAKPIKDKAGVWRLRTKYKDTVTNEWKGARFSGATKKEVLQKEIELQSAVLNDERIKDTRLLDYYNTWAETFKKGNVSPGRYKKILLVGRYMADFFGPKQTVRGVNKITYQKFINWLAKKGLAKETVDNYHAIVKSMFLEAFENGYIRINPTRKIAINGAKPKHVTVPTLSIADLGKLKNRVMFDADSNVKNFVLLQMMTGARYQEIAALKWTDVDFDDCYIDINKAFVYIGKTGFKEPKTKSGYRKINCDANTLQLLKRHKIFQSKKMLMRKLRNPYNLIFPNNKDGMPISNTFVNNYLKEACEKAGIARISSHGLRHARTDLLILSGADPLYVKDQLGHEDYNTTLKFYASLSDEIKTKNRNAVEQTEKEFLN